jgi:hypothetical protein
MLYFNCNSQAKFHRKLHYVEVLQKVSKNPISTHVIIPTLTQSLGRGHQNPNVNFVFRSNMGYKVLGL